MSEADQFLLWVAQTECGLLTDDLVNPAVTAAAEAMEAEGLLIRVETIEHIQVFRLSASGVAALGETVQ